MKRHVTVGLEKLVNGQVDILKGARVGLVCNQASVDHKLQHAADIFEAHPKVNLGDKERSQSRAQQQQNAGRHPVGLGSKRQIKD